MNRALSMRVALGALVLTSSAFAQTTFPEVEPNSLKSQATPVTGITAGDAITGLSTGTITTLGSTLATTVDVFRVRTAALPLGVYQHTLTITTAGPTGHTGYIRGLSQANGVIGTSDVVFQTSSLQVNAWYGFGKQEELNYQVQGNASTTAAYTATLTTAPVVPVAVAGTFLSGLVTVTTVGQGHTSDTELYLYDSNLNPIALGHHDGIVGNSTTSTVTLLLPAGTYYIANSVFNTSNNQSDLAPTEGWDDDNLLEYPDAMACNSTLNGANIAFSVSDGTTTTPVPATKSSSFEIIWATFTVIPNPNPPSNDNCATAQTVNTGTYLGLFGNATHDGAASCDAGGLASKDVWYSFTDPSGSGGTLNIDTCGTAGDTVLSVYNSCGGTELACNDNCGGAPCAGTTSCVTTVLAPFQNVRIRVSDNGLGVASFTLHVAFAGNPPVNDFCANPITLSGPGVYSYDTTLATSGEGTTGGCGGPPVKNLWYAYAATTNGTLTVTTCGQTMGATSIDTEIWIYQGAGCPILPAIACNDDACGLETTVTTPVTCGTVYMLQVGNYDGQTTANIMGTFTVTEVGTTCAVGVAECIGDTVAACPCSGPGGSGIPNPGLPGNGCANSSFATGANLSASGNAVDNAGDTLVLTCSNMPGPGLFFQSNALAGPIVNFNDGVLCAAVGIIRMGVVFPTAGVASYPGGLTPNPIHIAGAPVLVGGSPTPETKHYQCWYRDITPGWCNSQGHNMSNGLAIVWAP